MTTALLLQGGLNFGRPSNKATYTQVTTALLLQGGLNWWEFFETLDLEGDNSPPITGWVESFFSNRLREQYTA